MFGFDMAEASLPPSKQLNSAAFAALHADGRPHRICFGTTHSNALKPYKGKYHYSLSLPFKETIGSVILESLGFGIFEGKFGFWHGFETEAETKATVEWINNHRTEVYIRDLLDLSAATSMNLHEGNHTPIGEATKRAKYDESKSAIRSCSKALLDFIERNPPYGIAEVVCAVPPRIGKAFDLPTQLSQSVAEALGKPFVTTGVWAKEKPQLKAVAEADKWDALAAADLQFSKAEVAGKRVLLIDDLYQSGATSNFVAGRLKDAGATRVFGLSLVKSLRDSDNK